MLSPRLAGLVLPMCLFLSWAGRSDGGQPSSPKEGIKKSQLISPPLPPILDDEIKEPVIDPKVLKDLGPVGEPPSPGEIADFTAAADYLDSGGFSHAAVQLGTFLQRYPKSAKAPEAAYKRAVALFLLGRKEEALQAFEKVVDHYPATPWARLVLLTHISEEAFWKRARDQHKKGRQTSSRAEVFAALDLFELFLARFPQTDRKKEILYWGADCFGILAQAEDNDFLKPFPPTGPWPKEGTLIDNEPRKKQRDFLKKLHEMDREGDWGKLAAICLERKKLFHLSNRIPCIPTFWKEVTTRPFCQLMNELVDLAVEDNENWYIFLDLARYFEPDLRGEDLVKCQFHRAWYFSKQDQAKARDLFQTIVREHPKSSLASEAALWVAELFLAEKKIPQARQAYLDMAQLYPNSPLAAKARQWASWLDQMDETAAALERFLSANLKRLINGSDSIAFHIQGGPPDSQKKYELRALWQKPFFQFKLRYGALGLLFAHNKDGSWFQPLDQNIIVHSKEGGTMPQLRISSKKDPLTKKWIFRLDWGLTSESAKFDLDIAPEMVPWLIDEVLKKAHVAQKKVDPNRTVFTIEYWREKGGLVSLEVEVDKTDKLVEIRRREDWQSDTWSLRVTDIMLAEPLADAFLAVIPPAGTQIRPVANINPIEILSQGVRIGALFLNEVVEAFMDQSQKKRKPG